MHQSIVKASLVLVWVVQFYSVIGLVVWINKNVSDPRLSLGKIRTVMTIQKIILAAIFVFFAGDYVYNLLAGGLSAAPSVKIYLVSCASFLIIPAFYLMVLLKTKKRFLSRPRA